MKKRKDPARAELVWREQSSHGSNSLLDHFTGGAWILDNIVAQTTPELELIRYANLWSYLSSDINFEPQSQTCGIHWILLTLFPI